MSSSAASPMPWQEWAGLGVELASSSMESLKPSKVPAMVWAEWGTLVTSWTVWPGSMTDRVGLATLWVGILHPPQETKTPALRRAFVRVILLFFLLAGLSSAFLRPELLRLRLSERPSLRASAFLRARRRASASFFGAAFFLPPLAGVALCRLGLGLVGGALDQLEDGHLRGVAAARAELHDAGVAARTRREARADGVEQLRDQLVVRHLRARPDGARARCRSWPA